MKRFIGFFIIISMLCVAFGGFGSGAAESDPAKDYTHVDADFEDSGISLWFDYATQKISPDVTESTGMESFSVYMAKNEIENAQFVLYSEDGREDLGASLSGFTNESGSTLEADIFIELYHDCGSFGYVPDAIPPLSAYGAFDLKAGESQAFLVKITAAPEAESGWYSSELYITDSEGREIKKTTIFVYVWDFALSEETACATSVGLSYAYLNNVCGDGTQQTAIDLYKNYYDYLLENRVCAYNLPYHLYSAGALEYMDNPRVTSYQLSSFSGGYYGDAALQRVFTSVFNDEANAHRFDKAYYFAGVVDADSAEDLEALKSAYDSVEATLSSVKPSYSDEAFWFISTYIYDIDYTTADGTVIDQVDYYDDFVNLLCSKTFAYTREDELNVPGAKVLQPLKWDSVYGTFAERMEAYKAAGNKLWWFISWDVEEPYINYYMQTDGVAQRVLFWQQYDNGVEGFLYNFANFWMGDCKDPYNNNVTNSAFPNAHGESILIYPGNAYGLDTPVGSLRLEAMRDGIEDYQLFTMLDAKRDNLTDPIIDRMTTGMVSYSVSDEEYYNARIALGKAVEDSEAGICDHEYVKSESDSVPVSCTDNGCDVFVCRYCRDSYDVIIPAEGHSYGEDNTCSVCGDKNYVLGDINADGQISAKDLNLIKKYLAGSGLLTEKQLLAADVTCDGRIAAVDMNLISRFVAGVISEF